MLNTVINNIYNLIYIEYYLFNPFVHFIGKMTTHQTISDGIGWRHSNSLITTKRVHYPTKTVPTTTNQVVPGLSRPNENGSLLNVPYNQRDEAAHDFSGPAMKARPMKHWRRKLQPTPNSGRSVNSVSLVIDTPGGTTKSGNGESCDCGDAPGNSTAKFDEKLLKIPSQRCDPCVIVENKGYVQVGNPETVYDSNTHTHVPVDPNSYQIQTGLYNTKRIGCCPANNVIRSAVTLMSKAYYSDTRAYLQSRCKRYEQKLSTNPVPGIQYIGPDHMPNWPTEECNGPQTRLTGSCLYPACSYTQSLQPTKCQGITIYKPNNVPFAKQGGVSSSTRTLSLRVNAVNLNGNSFYSAFGAQGANAGKYSTEYNPCYFVKNNYQVPNCKLYYGSKPGNHTVCFYSPTENRTVTPANPVTAAGYA